MYIVSDEKYSEVLKIAREKSRLSDFKNWDLDVIDRREPAFVKIKNKRT